MSEGERITNNLEKLVELLRDLFLSDIVGVFSVDDARIKPLAHTGFFAGTCPFEEINYPEILNETSGNYVLWDESSSWNTVVACSYHVKYAIFLPILARNTPMMGILSLYRCYPTPYDQEDIALLVDVASRLGTLWQTQRQRAITQWHLSVLTRMSQLVLEIDRASRDDGQLMANIPEVTDRLLGLPQGSAGWGYPGDNDLGVMLAPDMTLVVPGPQPDFARVALDIWVANIQRLLDVKRLTSRLDYMAHHDALTGLPNRVAFLDTLTSWDFSGESLGLMLFDLDNFKRVNDYYGHLTGDAVLCHVTDIAQSVLMKDVDGTAILARYGGEEFVYAARTNNPKEYVALCRTFLSTLARLPYALPERSRLSLTASAGACISSTPLPPHTMMKAVDEALYRAKAQGKNRLVEYDWDIL